MENRAHQRQNIDGLSGMNKPYADDNSSLFSSWISLAFPVLLIYIIGLLMVYDASSGEIVDLASSKNEYGPFFKQFLWGVLSVLVSLFFYRIGWRALIASSFRIYCALVFLLVLVFVPGIGVAANGARRWISIAGFSLQPSEFVKLFLPAVYLWYMSNHLDKVLSSFKEFAKMMAFIGLPIVLIAIEPNNGTAGVIGLTIGVILVATRMPLKYWLFPALGAALALFIFAASSSYVQSRLQAYKNPEMDIKGKGHQPYQAKIAAGSGGLLGRGPAKSLQKLSYLPEAQNDYIAAIYAEEFGFVGMCFLVVAYGWVIVSLARVVVQVKSSLAFVWGLAIIFLISLQTFMNLGVVSGLLPSTGLNLPFFSQGGSSLLANFSGIGIIASMKKNSRDDSREE